MCGFLCVIRSSCPLSVYHFEKHVHFLDILNLYTFGQKCCIGRSGIRIILEHYISTSKVCDLMQQVLYIVKIWCSMWRPECPFYKKQKASYILAHIRKEICLRITIDYQVNWKLYLDSKNEVNNNIQSTNWTIERNPQITLFIVRRVKPIFDSWIKASIGSITSPVVFLCNFIRSILTSQL